MLARMGFSTVALATVTALALTAVEPSTATAGPAQKQGLTAAAGASEATDFSARRRHYRRGGGAAAAAAFAGIVGTGIAIAATQNRRHYYRDYYDGGPAYYGGGPVYYGGAQPYYRSRSYYGGHYYGGSNPYGRGGAFDTLTPAPREAAP